METEGGSRCGHGGRGRCGTPGPRASPHSSDAIVPNHQSRETDTDAPLQRPQATTLASGSRPRKCPASVLLKCQPSEPASEGRRCWAQGGAPRHPRARPAACASHAHGNRATARARNGPDVPEMTPAQPQEARASAAHTGQVHSGETPALPSASERSTETQGGLLRPRQPGALRMQPGGSREEA